MTDPRSYPEDKGPFDAAAATPDGEKVFTADDQAPVDDPAAPDAVQYDADGEAANQDGPGPDLLDAETNVDPDMSVDDGDQ